MIASWPERLERLDADAVLLGEHVLVAQDELGGVLGRHGHAEFGHLDGIGVAHQFGDHVRGPWR